MKYLFLALAALTLSCGPKLPANVQLVYNTDTLVNTIGILQDAAIGANNQKVLSDNDTRVIVTFCNSSLKTIKAAQNGWKAAVTTALTQLQTNVPSTSQFQSIISLIQVTLRSI